MKFYHLFERKVANDITVEHKEWFVIFEEQLAGQS